FFSRLREDSLLHPFALTLSLSRPSPFVLSVGAQRRSRSRRHPSTPRPAAATLRANGASKGGPRPPRPANEQERSCTGPGGARFPQASASFPAIGRRSFLP